MIRPPYAALRQHYPDKHSISPEELFTWIGHADFIGASAWENTCAIRLSLALNGVGVPTPCPRLIVDAGKYKGRQLQPSQRDLAKYLAQRHVWGEPEKYEGGELAKKSIGARRGVISFFSLYGGSDRQGHIDLVAPGDWGPTCEEDCYWSSTKVWFWPLK
jgi:hypothetical protein